MGKTIILIMVVAFNFSCSNGKVDEKKLDAAGEKLQKSVETTVDSAGAKLERLKEKLDNDSTDTAP